MEEEKIDLSEMENSNTPAHCSGLDVQTAWEKIKQQYPDRTEWEQDEIYALPIPLIDAIVNIVPGLFSSEDEAFERKLTEISGMGFFMKSPFYSEILCEPGAEASESQNELSDRIDTASVNIQKMLSEKMLSNGKSKMSVQSYYDREGIYGQRAAERRRGYAGWLITSPDFQISKMFFQKKWAAKINEDNKMPEFQKMKMSCPDPIKEEDKEFYSFYMQFYSKWSLDTLTTWHLPLPLHANPATLSRYSEDHLSGAGLTLFVPWYLLADQDLKLQDIAHHNLSYGHMQHLDAWINPNNQDKKKWGHARFAVMLEIYIYLICGLYKRYPKQIKRKKSKIDVAFTVFQHGLELSDEDRITKSETTRKTRQQLERRLKKCCNDILSKLRPEISE